MGDFTKKGGNKKSIALDKDADAIMRSGSNHQVDMGTDYFPGGKGQRLDDSDSEYEIEVIEYFEKTTAWFIFEQSDSDAEE